MIEIIIHTDGSCYPNPGGPGGWAAIITTLENDTSTKKEITGKLNSTTNNRAEMTAVLEALKITNNAIKTTIHTDSMYVVNGIGCWRNGSPIKHPRTSKIGWIYKWNKRQWLRGKNLIPNHDLWSEIYKLILNFNHFDILHVYGHNGDILNERCDQLSEYERISQ